MSEGAGYMLPEWAGYIIGLLGLSVGVFFLMAPHHTVRFFGRVANNYFRMMGATDQQIDARLELPWSRQMRHGLTQSEYLSEMEKHPERLTGLLCYCRVLGAFFAFMFGSALLMVVLLQVTGFIK